jgi:hypothetical protein
VRLSKTAVLILGIAIFALFFGGLYMVYSQQQAERQRLSQRLLEAHATLPGVAAERANLETTLARLEGELAQAELLLYQAKARFPHPAEAIEQGRALFAVAHSRNIEITSLTMSPPAEKVVGGITFSVTTLTMDLEGRVGDILNFFNTIAIRVDLVTAVVEEVNIMFPEPLTAAEKSDLTETEIAEREKLSVTIRLAITASKGE